MRSKFTKLVLALVLGVFLLTLPESGHAAAYIKLKTPVKKTKPAAATFAKPAAKNNAIIDKATPGKTTDLNPGAKAQSDSASTGTTKNKKSEFKKYREALKAQQLLDKIISVGVRLKAKSDKFSISNKLRETIIFRNELERDLAILAGIDIVTQVNTDTFVVMQEGIDPGAMHSMPSMPSISPQAVEYGCGAQLNDCNSQSEASFQSCAGNCPNNGWNPSGESYNSCGNNCASDDTQDGQDCRSQKSDCDKCKEGGGSNKECTGKDIAHDALSWIEQLLGYLDVINEMINMQNFTHEFNTDAIGMYNNVVDMTHQMISGTPAADNLNPIVSDGESYPIR